MSETLCCEQCKKPMVRGECLIISNYYGEWCSRECFDKAEAQGFSGIPELRARISELESQLECERKPWTYRLSTEPSPARLGEYPDCYESYALTIIDTGHSDRVLILGSRALDNRIKQADRDIVAMTAAIEDLLENIEVPSPYCTCHSHPPCSDCVEWSAVREAVANARAVLVRKQPAD